MSPTFKDEGELPNLLGPLEQLPFIRVKPLNYLIILPRNDSSYRYAEKKLIAIQKMPPLPSIEC